jgi:hypothetical protein
MEAAHAAAVLAVGTSPLAEREAQERVSGVEVESSMAPASAHEEAEGLVWKIALLEGALAEVCRAWEVAEENSCCLSDAVADAEQQWEESEREHQEQFEELTLLQAWGSKLCLAIVCPPRMRNHLSEGMHIAALRHTKMVRELTVLRAAVSSAVEITLGCSPNQTFRVEVVGELVAKFWKLEERHSRLEKPSTRICNLLLVPPSDRVRLADQLE